MADDYSALLRQLFYPGAIVSIEFVVDKDMVKSYDTRVADLEKEYLVLQSPEDNGVPVQFEEGRELTLWCESEQDKQAYVTSVFVIENRPGKVPLLVCCKPHKFERSSMRRYSRYEVELGCVCTTDGITASGQVTDISLGGCRVELDLVSKNFDEDPRRFSKDIATGLNFNTVITIPDQPELTFTGQAARVFEPGSHQKLGLALEIREISTEMRELLKNYLFQCQLMS